MPRKFTSELISGIDMCDEIKIFKEYWTDERLSICEALILSNLEEVIYEMRGSITTTKKNIYSYIAKFSDMSKKSAERFLSKLVNLGYIILVPDENATKQGLIRLSHYNIIKDMEDYIAGDPSYLSYWMLQYIPEAKRKFYEEAVYND